MTWDDCLQTYANLGMTQGGVGRSDDPVDRDIG